MFLLNKFLENSNFLLPWKNQPKKIELILSFKGCQKWMIEWPRTESNCRHEDFQSSALPTELRGLSINRQFLKC